MAAITAHKHVWQPSFDIHKGQYIAFWKVVHPEIYSVASLLGISRLTEDGIAFEPVARTVINPKLGHSAADRLHVTQQPGLQPHDALDNATDGTPVTQTI